MTPAGRGALLAATMVALVIGCSANPRDGPKTPITVINTAPTGAYAGFWTAIEAGYFADEGLEVRVTEIGSTSRAIPALLAGEAQFSTLDGQTVIQADSQGADIRLVVSITNHLVFSVMVSDDVPNPQALKGKKLGITRAGSAVDTAARQALKIFKLQPETDVALIPLDSGPNIVVGMVAHQIDGGVVGPPSNLRAKDQGFHELLNLAKEGPEFPSIAFGATHAYATEHPDVMLGFTRAYSRGVARFRSDRELAMKAYQKYLKIDDLRILGDTWDQYRPYLDLPPVVTSAGLVNAIEAASIDIPQARGTSPEKYFDGSWVQQLDQAGFFKELTAR